MFFEPSSAVLAASVNEAAAGGVGIGLIVAFAIVLLVNRSNSPDRYAQDDGPRGDSFVSDDDNRARGGGAVGVVIFAFGFVLRFVVTSPATVVGINLHPVGNVLMLIGGLSILAAVIMSISTHARRAG